MTEEEKNNQIVDMLKFGARERQRAPGKVKVGRPRRDDGPIPDILEGANKPIVPEKGTVGLSGIMMGVDGTLTQTKYFDMLSIDEDRYSDISFTAEEAKVVSTALRHLSTGLNATIPIICGGEICPFAKSCVYIELNKPPVGRQCLVEKQLILYWTEQFMKEFDVEMTCLTEIHLIGELVEYNVMEMRATKHLAEKYPTMLQDVVTAVSNMGDEIINEEIAKVFELKEKLKKGRMKVLEALAATRKEKGKILEGSIAQSSVADQLAGLRDKLEGFKSNVSQSRSFNVEPETIEDGQWNEQESEREAEAR